MAWRITHRVNAGELDNSQFGWTTGWLELVGIPERLQLKLVGNCRPDLAGWRFKIDRLEPELVDEEDESVDPTQALDRIQAGHLIDLTADQLIKHFEMTSKEVAYRLMAGEKPPFAWRKCFCCEWHDNKAGRVVIQSTRLEVERLGERAFELGDEMWHEQAKQNDEEMKYFLSRAADALESRPEDDEN